MRARPPAGDTARMTRTGAAFPFSAGQEQAWFLSALDPSGLAFSDGRCFLIAAPLEPGWLQAALDLLAARHEPLRTTFAGAAPGWDVPVQIVRPVGCAIGSVLAPLGAGDRIPLLRRRSPIGATGVVI